MLATTPARALRAFAAALLGALSLVTAPVWAQAGENEFAKVIAAAQNDIVKGPQDIKLSTQAVLHLPEGKVYVPQPHAAKLMHAMGNPGDYSDLEGVVFPRGDGEWFATLRFEKSGYIKDDDAKHWDAADMLKSFKEGTEASNEERKKMGGRALEITGWAQQPTYAADTHRLVWAMKSREVGAPADEPLGVNYNTYALGREGYMSLNLVTGLNDLPKYQGDAQQLLGALEFNDGKRYADFNASTDHVAEYGLAALVLGVGAKKLGLLAVIGAFFLKFAKVILLAGVAFGGAILKLFGRKKSEAAES
ncbi:DUF2167 domain-containing protein [Mitsuaria sp. TWR114]|uniref:DUF2167 domain-containing protein n=1 Tax=unclassified Roseateles TaxID=2626991 RepID=UPI0011BD4635|nr:MULTISPECIES: DUF2167 domain-containing protein [unclassified Roseateles]MBB3295486.1 putative membrane-anchored protein [Mitsuaria sp. BK041]MBB3364702.1 putative membrane-anchored protein [Mitsuaria sp. BK045]TXD78350.1 DUF2167 domain-containing protein [Mitsuaria sp. TWR114]TXD92999.1 DUF2167 domain-containing protein [Mitsuaria sp. TWR114]